MEEVNRSQVVGYQVDPPHIKKRFQRFRLRAVLAGAFVLFGKPNGLPFRPKTAET